MSEQINDQNRKVLEITLLKFLGSEMDKRNWLYSHGWEMNSGTLSLVDHENSGKSRFYVGRRSLDEALDCEVRFVLTGRAL